MRSPASPYTLDVTPTETASQETAPTPMARSRTTFEPAVHLVPDDADGGVVAAGHDRARWSGVAAAPVGLCGVFRTSSAMLGCSASMSRSKGTASVAVLLDRDQFEGRADGTRSWKLDWYAA